MKKTPKPRDTVQRLKETIHKQPAVFAVYLALRLIVLAELVMSIIRGEYESAFICLLVLALFILLNPNTAMNIVWGFMGVSIILEAGLEIATIILLK